MKAGFFHDSPMVCVAGKYYSRNLSQEIWSRYLEVFDELVVSTRIFDASSDGLKLSNHPGVSFMPIRAYSTPGHILRRFPEMVREIRKSLAEVDCAIVRLPSMIGWLTCLLAKIDNKPVIIEMVGCPWDAYRHHSFKGKMLAPLGFAVTRFFVYFSPFTIYVTQDFLQTRYPTRGESIGISNVKISIRENLLTNRLAKIDRLLEKKDATPRAKSNIVIGSIGQIDLRYKGHKSAIEAVSKLRQQGYNVEYQIVGPGNPESLEGTISDLGLEESIRLNGPYSSAKVDDWLRSIDLYVQPSLTEGLPRAVVEAMSHGLPVVLSNVGGHAELVSSEFLFPAGDASALAARLKAAIEGDWRAVSAMNFEKSTEYRTEKLQEKRVHFLSKFRSRVSRQD